MKLALFDLDNTLIAGDSDYLWGQFLLEQGYVDSVLYPRQQKKFYADYVNGKLNIEDFLKFQLQILSQHNKQTLYAWRRDYIEEKIKPIVLEKGGELLAWHQAQQHELMIVTATNRFVSEPISKLLGIQHLIACEVEIIDGCYTGRSIGIPSFREGKCLRLEAWLKEQSEDLEESWFYSDSHNDIPLLEWAHHPVVVDPDMLLAKEAKKRDWSVISLR